MGRRTQLSVFGSDWDTEDGTGISCSFLYSFADSVENFKISQKYWPPQPQNADEAPASPTKKVALAAWSEFAVTTHITILSKYAAYYL